MSKKTDLFAPVVGAILPLSGGFASLIPDFGASALSRVSAIAGLTDVRAGLRGFGHHLAGIGAISGLADMANFADFLPGRRTPHYRTESFTPTHPEAARLIAVLDEQEARKAEARARRQGREKGGRPCERGEILGRAARLRREDKSLARQPRRVLSGRILESYQQEGKPLKSSVRTVENVLCWYDRMKAEEALGEEVALGDGRVVILLSPDKKPRRRNARKPKG